MTDGQYLHDKRSAHPTVSLVLGAVCWGAAIVALFGLMSWLALCQDGTADTCLSGRPSAAVVLQAVIAVACLVAMIGAWLVSRSRTSLVPAWVALAIAVVLFLAWLLFLDAATHGWDDLKLLGGRSHELRTPGR